MSVSVATTVVPGIIAFTADDNPWVELSPGVSRVRASDEVVPGGVVDVGVVLPDVVWVSRLVGGGGLDACEAIVLVGGVEGTG